jgi:hypothetical protein
VVEDAWARNAEQVAGALNLLGVLAAPRLFSRWCAQATSSEPHAALRTRMEALATFCEGAWGSADAERFRSAAPRVRAFADTVARADPTRLFEPAWSSMARECLDALGLPAPPGGWEAFEGEPGATRPP